MKRSTLVLLTFLLGCLAGGVMKSAQAAGGDLVGVVRQLERIADGISEIKRDGLKCHE